MDNKRLTTVLTEDQLKKFQSIKNSNLQRGSQREETSEASFPDPQGMLCLKLFMMIEVSLIQAARVQDIAWLLRDIFNSTCELF